MAICDAGRKVATGIIGHCVLPLSALKQISPVPPHCSACLHLHPAGLAGERRSAGYHALHSYFNTKDFFAHLSTDCP